MKKILTLFAIILMLPAWTIAQNLDDALRYSQLNYLGTARFTGMGGAFTALGGDVSAIVLNPAAVAVFRSTEFTITPTLVFRNNTADFRGTKNEYKSNIGEIGQFGFVAAASLGSGSGLTGLSFAYTYNMTNSYTSHTVIKGISNASSMADYWASQANGLTKNRLADDAPGAYMAYESWLIDTIPGSNTVYESIFSRYGELEYYRYGQQTSRIIDKNGASAEHSIALGATVGDKLYLGMSLNRSIVDFSSHYEHSEIDSYTFESAPDLNIPDFVNFTYTDHFDTHGSGFNFKLGVIFRPVEMLRLGFSFSTPTVYKMNERYYSNLTAYLDGDTPDTGDDAHPEIRKDPSEYYYRITTPYRVNTGAALQLGNFALVSADFEYVDYSTARLSRGEDGYDFEAENEDLRNVLKSSGNLRLGGEVHFGSLYVRGGYRYSSSAFKQETLNEDWSSYGLSAGLGYRQERFFLDFAWSGHFSNESYLMYDDAYLDPVAIEHHDQFVTATVGIRF